MSSQPDTTMSAADSYQRGSFGGALSLGSRPSVLVVDLQLGFTDTASKLGADLDAVVEETRALLDVARENDVKVAYTVIAFAADLSDLGLWGSKAAGARQLVNGSRWTELDPRLGRRENEPVLAKQGASACFGTPLISTLAGWHTDTVVVTGATTSGCVRASTVDLFQFGYPVLVPRECVGDRFEASHDISLFDMSAKYADVVSADAAREYLSTTHPPRT